ncbi:MAG: MmgE/PrpD family protein, partial [Aeromicrobium sp.]|nr:MmgE/PrpD family protein [Burkholderiales bacterium]
SKGQSEGQSEGQSGGQGYDASVWGSRENLPAPSAAMVNALHIHNQEFDCVHEKAVVHPMAVILAALTAYAERDGHISGIKFLAALAIAVDVATVIGMSATKPIRFFRPAQCGCIGAAVGMAYLAEMDEIGIKNTLGLAYSQLAGTMQAHIEGTPALALQVAFAARAAVCAVDLAALGFRAPHDVLDGKYGYFALIEDGAANVAPFAELGKVWQITRVSHKPYPTGRAAQGAISALQTLLREHDLTADDVISVVLHAPPLIRQLVDRPYRDGMAVNYARLCLPYLLALVLRDGTVGLDAYSDTNLRDPQLRVLANRINVRADANADPNALTPQVITLLLVGSRAASPLNLPADIGVVYGSPEAPMSVEAQREKFIACCQHAPAPLSDAKIAALMEAINTIETTTNVTAFLASTVSD